jgi:hypothetical protein
MASRAATLPVAVRRSSISHEMSRRRFAGSPSAWARALCVAYAAGEPSGTMCVSQGKGSRGGCLPLCPALCYLCMRASCVLRLSRARSGPRRTADSGRANRVFSRTVAPRLSPEAPRHICPGPTDPAFRPTLGHPTPRPAPLRRRSAPSAIVPDHDAEPTKVFYGDANFQTPRNRKPQGENRWAPYLAATASQSSVSRPMRCGHCH